MLFTLEDLFAAARENSPMLRREQKMIERTEAAVNSARKEYYPDYTLSAGYFNMGSMPPMYEVRADFKLPLYFWRKQRAGVAEQVSNLSQARRNYEATDQSLHGRTCNSIVTHPPFADDDHRSGAPCGGRCTGTTLRRPPDVPSPPKTRLPPRCRR